MSILVSLFLLLYYKDNNTRAVDAQVVLNIDDPAAHGSARLLVPVERPSPPEISEVPVVKHEAEPPQLVGDGTTEAQPNTSGAAERPSRRPLLAHDGQHSFIPSGFSMTNLLGGDAGDELEDREWADLKCLFEIHLRCVLRSGSSLGDRAEFIYDKPLSSWSALFTRFVVRMHNSKCDGLVAPK